MESQSKKQQSLIISVLIILLAAVFVIYFSRYYHTSTVTAPETATQTADLSNIDVSKSEVDVNYLCAAGKSVFAAYHTDIGSVDLSLSDGRKVTLGLSKKATDTTDAEYSTIDGGVVFSADKNVVYVMEGTTKTYTNCAAQAPSTPVTNQ